MTRTNVEVAIAKELRQIAPEIDLAEIDQDGELMEEFDIDSVDFLNLVIALSKRFGIDIPESDYSEMGTFRGLVDHVSRRTDP
ncbi:MAG: acyl carrier protein [Rhizobiaceae bacterium]